MIFLFSGADHGFEYSFLRNPSDDEELLELPVLLGHEELELRADHVLDREGSNLKSGSARLESSFEKLEISAGLFMVKNGDGATDAGLLSAFFFFSTSLCSIASARFRMAEFNEFSLTSFSRTNIRSLDG